MKKVILEMEDQKHSYEQKAKESLQKVLEEKMSAEQQLQSTQVRVPGSPWGWEPWSGLGSRGARCTTTGTPMAPPSPLISHSGPWLWPSRSVKSGGASTRL